MKHNVLGDPKEKVVRNVDSYCISSVMGLYKSMDGTSTLSKLLVPRVLLQSPLLQTSSPSTGSWMLGSGRPQNLAHVFSN